MPTIVSLLSLLGLVPLLVLAFGAVGAVPFVADRMLVALVDYAAVMLAFAGGLQWGVGLLSGGGRSSLRLTAAVLPVATGWIALVVAQFVSASSALGVLITGSLATLLTEYQAAPRAPALPPAVWLRWGFSGVVVAMLALVLLLRSVDHALIF
ncbi:DUF3429 family protein [Rhodopila globiformis]|uniref:DUF3429 family protein n=1 Tax=Rhodopila globiformis TaxID=1071 RepID=UPI001304B5C7|nr:DUF3429 family protein [Rhodopila globiformis]